MAISALDHGHELQRPSTEVQRDAVAQRGRVGDREVGVAGLGATVEQADRQAGARSRGGEELLAVVRVADRARRDRVDRLPLAAQKWAKTSSVASARSMGSAPRRPLAARPSPMRTGSYISSLRRHQLAPALNTTSRNELDPRSITARRAPGFMPAA